MKLADGAEEFSYKTAKYPGEVAFTAMGDVVTVIVAVVCAGELVASNVPKPITIAKRNDLIVPSVSFGLLGTKLSRAYNFHPRRTSFMPENAF